jgi:AraC family transcriptional regulator
MSVRALVVDEEPLAPGGMARLARDTRRAARLTSLPDLALRLRALIGEDEAPSVLLSLARAMLVQLEPPESRRTPSQWLRRAVEELHARFGEPIGLSELARAVGVHPVSLARAFRACFGTSLGAYLRQLRVDQAAEQLVSTDLPIAAIAVSTGFSDQSHLTRLFRRAIGTTPARFRQRFRR